MGPAVIVHASLHAAGFENVQTQAELLDLLKDHLAHGLLEGDLELASVEEGAAGEDYDCHDLAGQDVVRHEDQNY